MNKLTALLIDDDRNFCQTFQSLSENTFDLNIAYSGKEGLERLKQFTPQVVLLDLKLGKGMNGLEVLKRIKKNHPDLPVIMVTDFADVESAVEAMKLGALHYTSKSPNINTLKLIIERQLDQINWKLLFQESIRDQYERLVAVSPAMQPVLEKIERVSKTHSTVLIEGESGTGKEVTAREIHRRSHRKDKPFVAVNCSTLSPQLFESEFFGHEKGAFTGAQTQKRGKLEIAHNSTIFLDEIGDLPLESQAKILRAIEDKSFQRLGGSETLSVDVRIIVASNKNLQQLVTEKLFREDLFYRLSVITITLPPLRDRKEDIPLLTEIFLKRYACEMNKPLPQLKDATIGKLKNYHWPGNIRELRNFIERLMVFYKGDQPIDENDIILSTEQQTSQYPTQLLDLPYNQAKQTLLYNFQQTYFKTALQKYGENISVTAQKLGLNRSSLHKILKELEIEK